MDTLYLILENNHESLNSYGSTMNLSTARNEENSISMFSTHKGVFIGRTCQSFLLPAKLSLNKQESHQRQQSECEASFEKRTQAIRGKV